MPSYFCEALYEWDPELFREGLVLHNKCLRAALVEFNGYEVREKDGEFLVAFHNESNAIQWAIACQKALLRLAWNSVRSLLGWILKSQ